MTLIRRKLKQVRLWWIGKAIDICIYGIDLNVKDGDHYEAQIGRSLLNELRIMAKT